ncbi:MAG TPA: hypothetical protein VNN10_13960 [Dehalococcoidia bacterium]|nr:hypothetical protein [Dehalococcoidia bacterium]
MFTAPNYDTGISKWLWFAAVLELSLAAVFIVVGVIEPELRFGFLLTGGILVAVGAGLIAWARSWAKRAAQVSQLKAEGISGQATILSMRQTGVYLNNQPQIELDLQIETFGHGSYRATTTEYVPLMLLGALTSGAPLPVKVDRRDRQNFVIEWEAVGSAAGMQAVPAQAWQKALGDAVAAFERDNASSQAAREAEKQRILATGIEGKATVLSATPTGQIDAQGRPVYDFVLRIEVPGRPPMQGPARAGVPPERAGQMEPGDTVPLKVDRDNPASMAIDWERAWELRT